MTGELARSALLAALAACHVHEPPRVADGAECPAPACEVVLSIRIDPAFSADERSLVRAGVAAWVEGTGGRFCPDYEGGPPDVVFRRAEYPVEFSHVDPHWREGHIGFWDGARAWVIPQPAAERQTTAAVAAHELGHALGLTHAPLGEDSLMLAEGGGLRDGGLLWAYDRETFCRRYACRCAR